MYMRALFILSYEAAIALLYECKAKGSILFTPATSSLPLSNSNELHILMQVDLAQLYLKAGLKNIGTVFLLTDAQVPDEKFLVLINDLLASGEIPDLFAGT